MRITIRDVARRARVAPSTVSRVIANHPRISIKTKEKVRLAMQELGYHPNVTARNLANQHSETIGIIMPASGEKVFQNPFFPEVVRGISAKAHQRKFGLHMTTGNTCMEILSGVERMVCGGVVDGVVLLYSRKNDPVFQFLKESECPFVVVGRPPVDQESIDYVDNDNRLAAKEATSYLIENGHKRIGFIGGSLDLMVTCDRLAGYKEALKNANLQLDSEYVVHEEFLESGGREGVRKLFQLKDPPTGLVITDDIMALGVLNALHEWDVRVPEDVALISFNNIMIAEFATPPITSVDINIYRLGYAACEILLDKIQQKKRLPEHLIVSHQIVKRKSSAT